jgi:hypothetical protein
LIYYTCDVNICVEIDPGTHMLCTRLCPLETGVTVLGSDYMCSFPDGGFLCFLLPESVAGFLELVELRKGLVVLPYLISLVEMNGTSSG